MPSDLFNRLQRVLPLADKVAEDIACEETGILEKIVPRMFEVMRATVKFSCDYVKRGRFGRKATVLDLQMLMIAERMKDGLVHSNVKEMVEKLDGELTDVIEDFLRAVDVEALYLAKKNGKQTSSRTDDSRFSIVPCRARGSARAAQTRRGRVSPAPPLHGRDPEISPQGNNGLGEQYSVAEGWF